ncbi:MAG: ComF family protein [Saprospiraceae bacterium]|nr:ComF family protein [Saprospiraceae bacterium]
MLQFIHPPTIPELLESFIHLWYPELCVACQHDMPAQSSCFCLPCSLKLMPFSFHEPSNNSFTARLWGRVPMLWGLAAYHFNRRSPIQKALHQLKYHNSPDIGMKLGRQMGARLLAEKELILPDVLIPVPLHPRKERLRGYNQSAEFATGLAEVLDIPVIKNVLIRNKYTQTQTKKKRMERFQNVGDVFALNKTHLIEGKHLLLVDDVLTTGATLELCGNTLLRVDGVTLSMATIAIADL